MVCIIWSKILWLYDALAHVREGGRERGREGGRGMVEGEGGWKERGRDGERERS